MESSKNIQHKSEILFLYEASYNIPNGDPFTGEQRYDEETKKILVSDVRMKRFVRDYLADKGQEIYVMNDKSAASDGGKESGSAARIKSLEKSTDKDTLAQAKKAGGKKFSVSRYVMKKCIDVRLFGGISTAKSDAINMTGPVQFALLNPSLNKVNLRMHQNTTVFSSSAEKSQGSIGTTSLVPYALVNIHGWVNPSVAKHTGLSDKDLKTMFEGLWYGTSGEGSSHSRSKVGQNSILLLEIVYAETKKKIYGVDRLIDLQPSEGKKEEEIRSMDDYELDFTKLLDIADSEKVAHINYYTEIEKYEKILSKNPKFKAIEL